MSMKICELAGALIALIIMVPIMYFIVAVSPEFNIKTSSLKAIKTITAVFEISLVLILILLIVGAVVYTRLNSLPNLVVR